VVPSRERSSSDQSASEIDLKDKLKLTFTTMHQAVRRRTPSHSSSKLLVAVMFICMPFQFQ
jgi:hypothetical protein